MGVRDIHVVNADGQSLDLSTHAQDFEDFLLSQVCGSVGRVTVDLFRRSWVRFQPRSKDFFLPRVVPCFPLLGLTPSGLFMGLSSTSIYTSELIVCSTICVPSATRHNIHMYP